MFASRAMALATEPKGIIRPRAVAIGQGAVGKKSILIESPKKQKDEQASPAKRYVKGHADMVCELMP